MIIAHSPVVIDAISLWNPWGIWVAMGWKTVETRLHTRFAKLVGRRIAIHYAKKWDPNALGLARPYLTESQIEQTQDFLKFGGHIGCTISVREARWLTTDDSPAALIDCGSIKRFGLVLEDPQIIPWDDSLAVPGRQGIFKVCLPVAPLDASAVHHAWAHAHPAEATRLGLLASAGGGR